MKIAPMNSNPKSETNPKSKARNIQDDEIKAFLTLLLRISTTMFELHKEHP